MAFIDDQQTMFKHFCRICKQGFMSGSALGGHMRAHGNGDERANFEDEDPGKDWEDHGNKSINKHMYELRTNPNRLKSCKACKNCGKEFISWKSFLEHGKCNFENKEPLQLLSPYDNGDEQTSSHLSKRKQSFSEEEDFAATCLLMLSNASVELDEPEESRASASKGEDPPIHSNISWFFNSSNPEVLTKVEEVANKGLFECKACKKVFKSHQALGGHRASHKKVKGCFASRLYPVDADVRDDDVPKSISLNFCPNDSSRRNSKVHECTICNRIFLSGQALGGHKRCHWITSNLPETSSLTKFNPFQNHIDQIQYQSSNICKTETLDLNLPVPSNDLAEIRRDPSNPLSFEVSKEINLICWSGSNNRNNDVNNDIVEYNNNSSKINSNNNNDNSNGNKDECVLMQDMDDEADGKLKFGNLSELKDMNVSDDSVSWLQVGIGLSTTVGSDP